MKRIFCSNMEHATKHEARSRRETDEQKAVETQRVACGVWRMAITPKQKDKPASRCQQPAHHPPPTSRACALGAQIACMRCGTGRSGREHMCCVGLSCAVAGGETGHRGQLLALVLAHGRGWVVVARCWEAWLTRAAPAAICCVGVGATTHWHCHQITPSLLIYLLLIPPTCLIAERDGAPIRERHEALARR